MTTISVNQFGATGGVFRPLDLRDRSILNVPSVADNLVAGPLLQYSTVPVKDFGYANFDKAVQIQYDQGGEGSCVPNSEAGSKSIEDWLESHVWRKYDAREVYIVCGGHDNVGVSTDQSLGYVRDVGFKDMQSDQRFKIASYAFVPRVPNLFRESFAAMMNPVAIGEVGRPGVLAALLPTQFGWDSNETPSGSYHQMCAVAYDGLRDDNHLILLNSWPFLRLVRLTWRYIESNGFLNYYNYAYGMWDATDVILPPPPPPLIVPVIKSVKVKKGGRKLIVTGSFSERAVAQVGGIVIVADAEDAGWMHFVRLNLSPGPHQLIITDSGATSAPYTFTVE